MSGWWNDVWLIAIHWPQAERQRFAKQWRFCLDNNTNTTLSVYSSPINFWWCSAILLYIYFSEWRNDVLAIKQSPAWASYPAMCSNSPVPWSQLSWNVDLSTIAPDLLYLDMCQLSDNSISACISLPILYDCGNSEFTTGLFGKAWSSSTLISSVIILLFSLSRLFSCGG